MPIEIVQGIAAFKNSVDSLNLLKNYADEIKDTRKRGELMRVIGELSIELGNAQLQLAQQMRANNQLLQDVAKLEAENEDLRITKGQASSERRQFSILRRWSRPILHGLLLRPWENHASPQYDEYQV